MRTAWLLAVLVILSACVPEPDAAVQPEGRVNAPVSEARSLPSARVIPVPQISVWQARGGENILWGFDGQGRLVLLNSSAKTVVLAYEDSDLLSIDDGIGPVRFFYDDKGKLLSAEHGILRWIFTYSSKGNLLSMENRDTLRVTHDSKGRLSSVIRDGGASTEFVYDELNRTEEMFKADVKTSMHYDTEGRLARMDRASDHLVIGYWRHDLLSSLSGTMYGLKETVNYGSADTTLVSNVEQNAFAGGDDAHRMRAFNIFLFCTRFRKIPVLFDGQSWVLAHEYLKYSITDYLRMGFICDSLP